MILSAPGAGAFEAGSLTALPVLKLGDNSAMAQVGLQNRKREITYHAHSLEIARSVDDIVRSGDRRVHGAAPGA